MRQYSVLILALIALAAPTVGAQTTQPAIDATDPRVEMRANQAFNRGEYATALPMFTAIANTTKDDATRLGAIQEKIRVCQNALVSLKNSPATQPSVVSTSDIATDPETRKKHAAPQSGQVLEMTIKELGNFQYDEEKGGNIPSDVKQLNGSKIRLRGFMIPMDQADRITQFALVPSLFSCCFGQPPQLQHTIVVNCPKGKAASYCPDEIIVEGQLTVQEKRDDGYVVSIFELGADSIKVAGK
jgi:hypothetical protein